MRTAITILAAACLCACATPEQTRDLISQPSKTPRYIFMADGTVHEWDGTEWRTVEKTKEEVLEEYLDKWRVKISQLTVPELLTEFHSIQTRIFYELTEEERKADPKAMFMKPDATPRDGLLILEQLFYEEVRRRGTEIMKESQ